MPKKILTFLIYEGTFLNASNIIICIVKNVYWNINEPQEPATKITNTNNSNISLCGVDVV